jgi:hypothetical protein
LANESAPARDKFKPAPDLEPFRTALRVTTRAIAVRAVIPGPRMRNPESRDVKNEGSLKACSQSFPAWAFAHLNHHPISGFRVPLRGPGMTALKDSALYKSGGVYR